MSIEEKIRVLAAEYAKKLEDSISKRVEDMKTDDKSHYLIYRVLGITIAEGELIDIYQNKGRFLYNRAGNFLEKAAILCFQEKHPDAESTKIPNTSGQRPKTFQIDCLINKDAIEIKWRDATTDGDHITKEHSRLQATKEGGYKPIRIMFYYPNRAQAMRIQQTLETLYAGMDGEYYFGDSAWEYIHQRTDIDLKNILEKIANENTKENRHQSLAR